MPTPLLDAFEESGDSHVGQTLVRLASLAASVHRFNRAQMIQNHESQEGTPIVEGLDEDPVVNPSAEDRPVSTDRSPKLAPAYKEVGR